MILTSDINQKDLPLRVTAREFYTAIGVPHKRFYEIRKGNHVPPPQFSIGAKWFWHRDIIIGFDTLEVVKRPDGMWVFAETNEPIPTAYNVNADNSPANPIAA